LHLRPADLFVKLASRFQAKIELVKDDERVDGKSILALLTLAAAEGTTLSIEATGDDADKALTALCELVEQNFEENQASEKK
jgi:phosphotransferase system HPr (HPr) family protein